MTKSNISSQSSEDDYMSDDDEDEYFLNFGKKENKVKQNSL
jgi:hypothetical protein